MELKNKTCKEFVELLGEKQPVPGGGGAAALVGAIGTSLNTMVANYSIGKKKFMGLEEKHTEIINKGKSLSEKLLMLIDEDAQNFEPLSKAYGLPKNTEEEKLHKEEVLQSCLKVACSAPVDMVECIRSEERRVGKECTSWGRARWAP